MFYFRLVLLPGFDRELQPGPGCPLQVHSGRVQDGTDQGSGEDLSGEQLLRPREGEKLPQGTEECSHL